MCQFVETLCLEKGTFRNLRYHEARLNATCEHFYDQAKYINLTAFLNAFPKTEMRHKVRVVYTPAGITDVSISLYEMRRITTLRLVTDDNIDYSFKSTDRRALNLLSAQCQNEDEILIVKNGEVTDTSYTNVALSDGENWYTPAHPLLRGTMRAALLDEGRIIERPIFVSELNAYTEIMLFNAMIPFGEVVIPVSAIRG